jgi:hypothetical protein
LLARLPRTHNDGGGEPIDPKRCLVNTDCPDLAFCARTGCGDESGTCMPVPLECEDDGAPVCDCDGITYWNDCLRMAAKVSAATVGACLGPTAKACTHKHGPGPAPEKKCPGVTFCAQLLPPVPPGAPADCPEDVPGTCWAAVPFECPQAEGRDRWVGCTPDDQVCRTTCAAIRSGKPHRHAEACP